MWDYLRWPNVYISIVRTIPCKATRKLKVNWVPLSFFLKRLNSPSQDQMYNTMGSFKLLQIHLKPFIVSSVNLLPNDRLLQGKGRLIRLREGFGEIDETNPRLQREIAPKPMYSRVWEATSVQNIIIVRGVQQLIRDQSWVIRPDRCAFRVRPNPLEIRVWSWIRDEAFDLRSNPNMVWHRYNRNPALGVRPHGKLVWWEDETCNYFYFKTPYAVKKPTRKVSHGIKITIRVCIIIIVWWVRGYVCIFWSRHVYRGMVRMEDWL